MRTVHIPEVRLTDEQLIKEFMCAMETPAFAPRQRRGHVERQMTEALVCGCCGATFAHPLAHDDSDYPRPRLCVACRKAITTK